MVNRSYHTEKLFHHINQTPRYARNFTQPAALQPFPGHHPRAVAPKRELRGAWVATYLNIDWPNRSQTPAQQRAAFIAIADHHKATGLNALYIQVRSQCDAMYYSELEPWSADLTGTQGNAPSTFWDPMAFAIEECHKRGMEFHAWINPYRAAGNSNNLPGFAANHVARAHPEWLLSQGSLRVLDPGLPAVRDHISAVIGDIIRRYDVDGIHFDDYFYPLMLRPARRPTTIRRLSPIIRAGLP